MYHMIMNNVGRAAWAAMLIVCSCGIGRAAVAFTPRELFQIPFGADPKALGARVESGQFLFPRLFTMDGAGHFYIYDSIHHRIARYAGDGRYEMEFRYPETARQIFAHPDSRENLWLLISDPSQGMFYGVYDARGKRLNAGIFSRFNDFHLHLDDDGLLHVTLSSNKDAASVKTYVLDEKSLLMKKENIAPPPEDHHEVRAGQRLFYVDAIPGAKQNAQSAARITDQTHHTVAEIKGTVIYVTQQGELYREWGRAKSTFTMSREPASDGSI